MCPGGKGLDEAPGAEGQAPVLAGTSRTATSAAVKERIQVLAVGGLLRRRVARNTDGDDKESARAVREACGVRRHSAFHSRDWKEFVMRWISSLACGVLVAVALVAVGQVAVGATHMVEMRDNQFEPKVITIS